METDTVTIETFVNVHGISMTCKRTDRNPNMDDATRPMHHWKCTLIRRAIDSQYDTWHGYKGKLKQPTIQARMTLAFSMGSGHKGAEPKVTDVLDCLASDAASVDQNNFENWCSELGYDADSRKAEKIYKACEHQRSRLMGFLGDAYEELLYATERM